MKEYKIWAFARSAAPNLPALEEQLADVMREADRRGYISTSNCETDRHYNKEEHHEQRKNHRNSSH